MDMGWSIGHEGYSAFGDYDADVQIYGNGCDGTVLTCEGHHGRQIIPPREFLCRHSGKALAAVKNMN